MGMSMGLKGKMKFNIFILQKKMILPIRCYTCGKVLANLTLVWEQYKKEHSDDYKLFFEKYNIQRYCCKRVLMAQVPDPNYTNTFVLPSSVTLSNEKISNMFLAR